MRRLKLFASVVLLVNSGFAQITFERTYNCNVYDFGKSVRQTSDDGYILFGNSGPGINVDQGFYLIKTDSFGDALWVKFYATSGNEYASEVEITNDGGYILCGNYADFVNGYPIDTMIILKVDGSGNPIWETKFPQVKAMAIKQTNVSDYIVVGYTISPDTSRILLLKVNSIGELQWSKTFFKGGGADIQILNDGYIILGSAWNSPNTYDAVLLKTTFNGDTVWTKKFVTSSAGAATSIEITNDGGFVFTDYDNFPAPVGSAHVVKTDIDGNQVWQKSYGGQAEDQVYSIANTSDGGYVISGHQGYYPDSAQGLSLVKMDSGGNIEWKILYSSGGSGRSVRKTSDDGFIILGGKNSDFYLIKTNGFGVVTGDEEMEMSKTFIELNPRIVAASFEIMLRSSELEHPIFNLYDILGRKVFRREIISGDLYTIDCSQFSNGIFIAQLLSNGQQIWSGKICVQH